MTQSQSSLLTAGMICAATASVIAGIAMREHVDVGGVAAADSSNVVRSGLLASRTNETQIPEAKYFTELSLLLKQKYVEPIKDDMKLATGAVRGMVGSLNDVESIYFTVEMARTYEEALKGHYEGIGADIELVRKGPAVPGEADDPEDPLASTQLPRVVVSGVAPGGPADKAGVKPGDWVESINGHWIYNQEALDELRMTQQKVQAKEWPSSKLHDLSIKLRKLSDGAIMPYKALERLMGGDTGALKIVWHRNGVEELISSDITKAKCEVAPLQETAPGVLRIRLVEDMPEKLAQIAAQKNEWTLDLRSEAYGDAAVLEKALAVLGPSGKYGALTREGGKPSVSVEVKDGASRSPKLTILLDERSGGLYQAFAMALASRTGAAIEGKTASPRVSKFFVLPDGSAYSLVIGTFHPAGAEAKR